MNISEYVSGKRLNILIKGESGVGKSIQAGSFPNVYFFDFDGRVGSVVEFYRKRGRTDIDMDYYSKEELEKAWDKIEDWKNYGCPYQTLVIDTTTTLIDAKFSYIEKQKGMVAKSNNKESFGMKVQLGKIEAPALDDYKFLLRSFKGFMGDLKQIKDIHLIVNAHVMLKEKNNPDGSSTLMRMILAPGQTASEIPIHFDEIYHMEAEQGMISTEPAKRVLITSSNGMDFARTSFADVPIKLDVSKNLLYDQLCNYIPGLKEVSEKKKEVKQIKKVTI